MIIKTFVGESSAAALKQVRAELGGDAVVLATRRVTNARGGYSTEVTACLDSAVPSATLVATAPAEVTRKITKPVWNRMVTKSSAQSTTTNRIEKSKQITNAAATSVNTEALRDLDIPTSVISEIIDAVSKSGTVQDALTNQLSARSGAFPRFEAGDTVLVLGPLGAGKTSVVSKLAGQLSSKNQRVTLTGFQQQKIGAIDELRSIADLVGIQYADDSAKSADTRGSVTLIDCGTLAVTAGEIAALNPTHTLFVAPATVRSADMNEMISRMSGLTISGVCMTMLDQTHRLGSIFGACDSLNAPLTMISVSAFGAESLVAPNAGAIASRMLGKGEYRA